MARIVLNNIPFDDAFLADSDANVALGRFMAVWGQIEVVCGFIFRSLTNTNVELMMAFMDNVGVKEQIAIVQNLAEAVKDEDAKRLLMDAMSRVQDMSTKRNKIVHASWGTLNDVSARYYTGLTSSRLDELMRETQRGKTYPGTWVFTVEHLKQLIEDGIALRKELEALIDKVRAPDHRDEFHSRMR